MRNAQSTPWWLACLLALMTLLGACSDSPAPEPSISVQPSDTSVVAGQSATLSVAASGPDISYQWQLSIDSGSTWSAVSGATQASYTTPVTSAADNGKRYRVVVTASSISVNSSAVQLTVTAAVVTPSLTVQPAAQTATAPNAATFSVTVSGTSPAYQWQRSTDGGVTWSNISGATAASYSTGTTSTTMSGERYRVVVSNSAGSVTSSGVTLTVEPTPVAATISAQPSAQTTTAGSAAAFSVTVVGTPTPTLQWQRSSDGGSTWANIASATAATYNTGAVTLAQNGERYRVIASNASGSVTSSAVTLSVNPASQAPAITTQPTAQTVTAPAAATFTVAASGVPTPSLQWQLSSDNGATWANIAGATAATYTTPATATTDSGRQYRVIATNSAGSATTNAALLTVNPAAPAGRSWGTAVLIETDNADGANEPRIAFDSSGNALAVWQQSDGIRDNIWANRYTAGVGWGTAQLIEADNVGNATSAQIAVDASGNAIAVWQQYDGVRVNTRANRYTAGVGWGTPQRITTSTQDEQGHKLAVDPAGNMLVVWQQREPLCYSVWANRYTAGSGWGTAQVIENNDTSTGGCDSEPDIAVDANGNAIAVWSQSTPATPASIVANRYTAGVGWGTVQLIETDNAGGAIGARIAFDASGNALAVWDRGDGARSNIWSNRYTAGVGWGTAQLIETDITGVMFVPRIAVDPSGNALAVWQRNATNGTQTNIGVNRYTAGAGWGTAQALTNDPAGVAWRPHIAMDASGNAIAVWIQHDGTRFNVWANTFR